MKRTLILAVILACTALATPVSAAPAAPSASEITADAPSASYLRVYEAAALGGHWWQIDRIADGNPRNFANYNIGLNGATCHRATVEYSWSTWYNHWNNCITSATIYLEPGECVSIYENTNYGAKINGWHREPWETPLSLGWSGTGVGQDIASSLRWGNYFHGVCTYEVQP
jgi:hypothetical protein